MMSAGVLGSSLARRAVFVALCFVPACAAGTVFDGGDDSGGESPPFDGGHAEVGGPSEAGPRDSGARQDTGAGDQRAVGDDARSEASIGDSGSSDGEADGSAGDDAGDTCLIAGTTYTSGSVNPGDLCQVCRPAKSATSWSNLPDGTTCATDEVCTDGACASGCFIAGVYYTADATNPSDPCQVCTPATSTTSWSSGSDGTSCGAGEVCTGGSCEGGCFIGGVYYAPSAANPANECQSCQPSTSTTAWSDVPNETACSAGSCCTGACVDESSATNDCGGCGIVCPGTANGAPECSARACTFACDPGYILSGGACVSSTCSFTFPSTTSTVGGPDGSGTLGSGGGGKRYQAGDYVEQTFACANPSITSLTVDFKMSDRTYYECGELTWNIVLNGTVIGTYEWNDGYGPGTVTISGPAITFPAVAAIGGEYTLEYIATNTVCKGGGAWNWIAGGSASIE